MESKPKKGTVKSRPQRIQARMEQRIDQTSGGKISICKKCGKSFEQVWRPERQIYTQFELCSDCRMAIARGYFNAHIPYKPHENQIPIHNSTARFKVLAAGARFGKDRCMVNEFILKFSQMLSEYRGPELIPSVHGWIIAPTFTLARQLWRELKTFFPNEWIMNVWDSDKMIETVNDGIIEVRSADDPEGLVGVGLDIVLITEAGRIKNFDLVWANLEMRLLSDGRGPDGTGGLALINGTPRGKGFYYDMYRWGQKKIPEYEQGWESWQFSSWDNPYLMKKDKKYLQSIKRRFPKRIYDQEVLGLFIADGSAVFPDAEKCATYTGNGEPEPGEIYTIGYDPARTVDFAGIVIRNSRGQAIKAERLMGGIKSWTSQLDRIEYYSRKYNNAVIVMDCNGPGETIPEMLTNRGLEVISNRFSNAEKEAMVNNLAILLEQELISYPKDPIVINELQDYTYEYTRSNKIRFSSSSQSKHDDIVSAMMLAFYDYQITVFNIPWVGRIGGVNIQKGTFTETSKRSTKKQDDKKEKHVFAETDDIMFNICVRQGYVPPTCTMPGEMIFRLMQSGEDPCAGCNEDRRKCKGRPRQNKKVV